MRYSIISAVWGAILLLTASCTTPGGTTVSPDNTIYFGEVWAYLMRGEEKEIKGNEPITDLCYFSASVSGTGRLGTVPAPPSFSGLKKLKRTHIVITELSNASLTHFCIRPDMPVRDKLITDIIAASQRYDGVQIDFESVMRSDAALFHRFLSDLKKGLGEKILSIAVPARRKDISNDPYDYKKISEIVDRVIIMAYDQHWSTGDPGPVASLPWCGEIIQYARPRIPYDKLIMGVPLYGRAWQERSLNRAVRYSHIPGMLEASRNGPVYSPETGNYLEYEEKVKVKVYYDDIRSMSARLGMFRKERLKSVAFWRIGQGPPELWNRIGTL
ncbi:MAG TPA: glycosyl hydrolase family 18 protein [Spirochaetota bacterium]|nr:glycosyl hydrolase family 18 protein [Spirochaetota bacterium]